MNGRRQRFNRLKTKHERLLSLLTEKGVLAPGEIDGIPSAPAVETSSEPQHGDYHDDD